METEEGEEGGRGGIGGTVLTKLWVLDLLMRTVEYARSGHHEKRSVTYEDGTAEPQATEHGREGCVGTAGAGGEEGRTEDLDTGNSTQQRQGAEVEDTRGGHSELLPYNSEPNQAETQSSKGAGPQDMLPGDAGLQTLKTREVCADLPADRASAELVDGGGRMLNEGAASPRDLERSPSSLSGGHSCNSSDGQRSGRGGDGRGYASSDGYVSGRSEERRGGEEGGEEEEDSGMDSDLEEELCILWDASMIQVSSMLLVESLIQWNLC